MDPHAVPVAKAEPYQQQTVQVQVPAGVSAGQMISVQVNGQMIQAQVPPGLEATDTFTIAMPAAQATPVMATPVPATAVSTARPVGHGDAALALRLQQRELGGPVGLAEIGVLGAGAPHLDAVEQVVLNYQHSIKCFALIDIFFQLLDIILYFYWFSFILFAGPVCGYFGAMRLQRNKLAVYLAFCCIKCMMFIAQFLALTSLWYLLLIFANIWITTFVYKFWRALGLIHPERLEVLADPRYRQNVRFVYY